ncbi:MAG: hypothetical protein ABIX01_14895 [Chitinophagaceae bacterium]
MPDEAAPPNLEALVALTHNHEAQRSVLRKTEMLVMEHQTGRIQYEAATLS